MYVISVRYSSIPVISFRDKRHLLFTGSPMAMTQLSSNKSGVKNKINDELDPSDLYIFTLIPLVMLCFTFSFSLSLLSRALYPDKNYSTFLFVFNELFFTLLSMKEINWVLSQRLFSVIDLMSSTKGSIRLPRLLISSLMYLNKLWA